MANQQDVTKPDQAAQDNRSRQLNPNNDAYWKSRGQPGKPSEPSSPPASEPSKNSE